MTVSPGGTPASRSGPSLVQLIAIVLLTLTVSVSLRFVHGSSADASSRVPYLPAFPGHRSRPLQAERIPELRQMNPGAVVIGDSMAGTRIDERLLSQLSGVLVAPLLQAGSGPAFWYLALKNWVVASGIKPRVVFIFFRDTNLTDVMFRLDDQYRWSLDMVAGDTEDELNDVVQSALDGPFYAVHQAVERIYHVDAARRTIEPIVSRAPARWIAGSAGQARLLEHANQRFGLDHLRVMEAADMAADAGTDFAASVKHSVLRLMLRDAQRGGFKLIIDYCGARGMESRPEHRRKFLWMSIVTNFGMLGFFKYFNFFVDNVAAALAAMGLPSDQPTLRILLPVGISFYTFQAMSYTIDVYRGVPITACCSCSPARAGS